MKVDTYPGGRERWDLKNRTSELCNMLNRTPVLVSAPKDEELEALILPGRGAAVGSRIPCTCEGIRGAEACTCGRRNKPHEVLYLISWCTPMRHACSGLVYTTRNVGEEIRD
nr:hypothetical protein CFP56_19251 [Quercus suber]